MNKYLQLLLPHSLKRFLIHINSDFTELIDAVFLYWSPFCSWCDDKEGDDVLIEIRESVVDCAYDNHKKSISYNSIAQVLGIVSTIVRNLCVCSSGWQYLHGSALMFKNKTFIFLGKSHSGKSVLNTLLSIKPSVLYLDDDLLTINLSDFSIEPHNRYIFLRESATHILSENMLIDKCYYSRLLNRYYIKPYSVCNKKQKISAFFVLNRKETLESIQVDQLNGHSVFLDNSYLIESNMKNNIFSSIILSSNMPIYLLSYSNVDSLYNYLFDLY